MEKHRTDLRPYGMCPYIYADVLQLLAISLTLVGDQSVAQGYLHLEHDKCKIWTSRVACLITD